MIYNAEFRSEGVLTVKDFVFTAAVVVSRV